MLFTRNLPKSVALLVAAACLATSTHSRESLVNAQSTQTGAPTASVGLVGRWQSIFDYAGTRLHLVLNLSKSDDGSYVGTLDSPDQGATGLKLDAVTLDGTGFKFFMGQISASFDGVVSRELDEIVGNWKQGPISTPMVFRREGAPAHAAIKRGAISLEPCNLPKLSSDAYCGKYEVYEDRTQKSGRKIALGLLLFRSRKDKPEPDPVFFIAGGPGQSAVSVVSDAGDFLSDLRKDRDIIFIDQRGTGASNLLDCQFFKDVDNMPQFFGDIYFIDKVRQCKLDLEKKANLNLYNTPIAMDDLDEVRGALGFERINLLGGSYGTNAALAYVRQHPEHIRAVVLKGVAPMEYKLPLPFAKGVQSAMYRLFADCAADETCNKNFPNIKSELDEVLGRLEKEPATFMVVNAIINRPQQVTLTRAGFAEGLRVLLYSPDLTGILPLLIHQAHECGVHVSGCSTDRR